MARFGEPFSSTAGRTFSSVALSVALLLACQLLLSLSACSPAGSSPGGAAGTSGQPLWKSPKVTKVPSPLPKIETYFGLPVLLKDNDLHAAALRDGEGSLYVYSRNGAGWSSPAKLISSDGQIKDEFGLHARDGNTLAVGAQWAGGWTGKVLGAAYIFQRSGTTWKETQKLTASDGASGSGFGVVALEKDLLAIGAPFYGSAKGPNRTGAVHLFARNGAKWAEQQKLIPANTSKGRFGKVISLQGDWLMAAAPNEQGYPFFTKPAGAVYTYHRKKGKWQLGQRLTPKGQLPEGKFGSAIALDKDTLAIGERHNGAKILNAGAVYIFNRSGTTWSQSAKLTPADLNKGSNFGVSVALQGNTLVVGAYGDDDQGLTSGAAYVFARSGTSWKQKHKLHAPGGQKFDMFGYSVSLAYPLVAVSAPLATVEAVYVFELNVLVSHDGGPPGTKPDRGPLTDVTTSLDRPSPLETSANQDRGEDLHDIAKDLTVLDAEGGEAGEDPGCTCTLQARTRPNLPLWPLLLVWALLPWRRRR